MEAKRLEDYSERNQALIVMSRPDATLLAGYKQWRKLGRQVRKGERGIAIGAPVTVKQDDGTTRMVNVRGARVFDVGQTDPVLERQPGSVSDHEYVTVEERDRLTSSDDRLPAETEPVGQALTIGERLARR